MIRHPDIMKSTYTAALSLRLSLPTDDMMFGLLIIPLLMLGCAQGNKNMHTSAVNVWKITFKVFFLIN